MAENFLFSNPEDRVKLQVKNICESYSHPWDVLAELAQNSVDAIREWDEEYPSIERDHSIELLINKESRSIEITDTGIGIKPDRLPELLAPNATDKAENRQTIGEKGVGLTFCIFCSNKFRIETNSPDGLYEGEIHSARTWRQKDSIKEIPDVEAEKKETNPMNPDKTGTRIILDDIFLAEEKEDIFELSPERLKYLLRTKTAIGNTKENYEEDQPDIDVFLEIQEEDGDKFSEPVDFRYYFPHEFWEDEMVIDVEDFEQRDDIARLSDSQKEEKLGGKCWTLSGKIDRNGRIIRYYGFFVPSTNGWEKVAKRNNLVNEEEEPDIEPGIYISTRGMPTGIKLSEPSTGSKGFWNNVYLLLGYDGFQFDLGRKSIPSATQVMLKDIARDKFLTFRNWRDTIRAASKTPATKPPQVSRTQRENRFKKLERIQDLNYPEIEFHKIPDTQEAGVVAIFHELIGSGILDNYKCYRTGYNQDYDFWGRYEAAVEEIGENVKEEFEEDDMISQNLVIEFKFDASDVIKDVIEERKYLEDIDMIVCWEIDKQTFRESSVTVEPLPKEDVFYVGSNYKLVPTQNNSVIGPSLYIFSLQSYIERKKFN